MSDEKSAIPTSDVQKDKKLERINIPVLNAMKKRGEVFSALSIYNRDRAKAFDRAGGHLIVVGDSASMAEMGRPDTIPMTMDEMLVYNRAVCRGTERLFVVADMPFMSYEPSDIDAVKNAGRYMKETGDRHPDAVKIEVMCMEYIKRIKAVSRACLVVAHIGLNPTKASQQGGYRLVGKTKKGAEELRNIALAVQDAGACMILIETVPEEVSQTIREIVEVPVFGIAAGRGLDGQLLISSDMLGEYEWPGNMKKPKHFKVYRIPTGGLTIGEGVLMAFRDYVVDVQGDKFPEVGATTEEGNVHFLPKKELKEVEEYLGGLIQERFEKLRAKYPRPPYPDTINLNIKGMPIP